MDATLNGGQTVTEPTVALPQPDQVRVLTEQEREIMLKLQSVMGGTIKTVSLSPSKIGVQEGVYFGNDGRSGKFCVEENGDVKPLETGASFPLEAIVRNQGR